MAANVTHVSALFLSGGRGCEFASKRLHDVGRIPFLPIAGLRSHFLRWPSAEGFPQFLEAALPRGALVQPDQDWRLVK